MVKKWLKWMLPVEYKMGLLKKRGFERDIYGAIWAVNIEVRDSCISGCLGNYNTATEDWESCNEL